MHNTEGVIESGPVGAADEQTALLLPPDLATAAFVVVERRLEVQDLAPELLRHTVGVHLGVSIGRAPARYKRYGGSSFVLARRD